MTKHWRPSAVAKVLQARALMLQRIRRYFMEADVLEVETQTLDRHGVTDPQIQNLSVQLQGDENRFFLHTSPEYQMKRLLADGAPDIFQVCSVFRDGEAGARHQPEFRMLEWYRHGFGLNDIVNDTLRLIESVSTEQRPIDHFRYAELFQARLGVNPISTSLAELRELASQSGLASKVDRDACLDFLMDAQISRHFAADRLTVIYNYPATQASLAQLDPLNPSEALRFEVYAGPLELANGFVELGNAREQRERFELDREKRRAQGKPDQAIDSNLLDALASGLPACAGVAIGLDRLLMSVLHIDDIRQVQAFPACPD